MLRGFLVIFILCGIAILAVFGFRGRKSTAPPTEIFPDMVRQMKVRAQAPLGLFADGRGPRLPVAGTVPIGYEMPKPGIVAGTERPACRGQRPRLQDRGRIRILVLARAPIITTQARWAITGEQAFRFRLRPS